MSCTTETAWLDPSKVNGFAALCGDRSVVVNSDDQLLPLGWHQLYTHASDPWLHPGADGHPRQRPRDVPAHLTKRMWAGTEVRVEQPIQLAGPLIIERDEPLVSIKHGSSRELAFSREVTRWRRGALVVMEEAKTVVYKAAHAAKPANSARALVQAMPAPCMQQVLVLDEVALFKYSALLGVAHRIHFDYPYATLVEGYPGLVIHGPLLIQLLLNLARASQSGAFCGTYTARALRPSFLGMPLQLNLARQDGYVLLWVSDDEGQPTLVVKLHL